MTVLIPLRLQTVMSYTPTWACIATAPVGILALIAGWGRRRALSFRLSARRSGG